MLHCSIGGDGYVELEQIDQHLLTQKGSICHCRCCCCCVGVGVGGGGVVCGGDCGGDSGAGGSRNVIA
ncbi:Hypothetical predicted protein [Octopus vulgaris]|uniref:Uncharacterized protein n=1 Tax=Octopus vulgaris TaxID=6645 RepID=A0AA36BQZ7_OCTVU|nr:Hypothetical predicted protein [Octopus vulgaris]